MRRRIGELTRLEEERRGGWGARTDSLQDDADTEIPYAVAHARMVTRDVRLRGGIKTHLPHFGGKASKSRLSIERPHCRVRQV